MTTSRTALVGFPADRLRVASVATPSSIAVWGGANRHSFYEPAGQLIKGHLRPTAISRRRSGDAGLVISLIPPPCSGITRTGLAASCSLCGGGYNSTIAERSPPWPPRASSTLALAVLIWAGPGLARQPTRPEPPSYLALTALVSGRLQRSSTSSYNICGKPAASTKMALWVSLRDGADRDASRDMRLRLGSASLCGACPGFLHATSPSARIFLGGRRQHADGVVVALLVMVAAARPGRRGDRCSWPCCVGIPPSIQAS